MPRRSPEAIARHLASSLKRKQDNRARVASIKETAQCTDCPVGVLWPSCVLSFDHLDGEQKLHDIANMMSFAWEKIQAEIAKTVVCHNHHALRTERRRGTLEG